MVSDQFLVVICASIIRLPKTLLPITFDEIDLDFEVFSSLFGCFSKLNFCHFGLIGGQHETYQRCKLNDFDVMLFERLS